MSSPRNSVRARRICFETHRKDDDRGPHLICHICGGRIDPVRTPWRADHIRRFAEGGQDEPDNLWPICIACDTGPGGKAANDTREVAKGKRVAAKHFGLVEKRGPPMPGTKRSKYKRKMNGEVVLRDHD